MRRYETLWARCRVLSVYRLSFIILSIRMRSFWSFLPYFVLMARWLVWNQVLSVCVSLAYQPSLWGTMFSPWPALEKPCTSLRPQELNKFDDMMAYLHRECPHFLQVVAIDTHFMIFSRAWCVAELVQADASHLEQHMMIHSPGVLEKRLWLQVFGTESSTVPPWNLTNG